jgi:hypothetical protein
VLSWSGPPDQHVGPDQRDDCPHRHDRSQPGPPAVDPKGHGRQHGGHQADGPDLDGEVGARRADPPDQVAGGHHAERRVDERGQRPPGALGQPGPQGHGHRQQHQEGGDGRGRRGHCRVAQLGGFGGAGQPADPVAAAVARHCEAAPLHVVGGVDRRERQHGGRHVGELDVARPPGRGRLQQAAPHPGRGQRRDPQRRLPRRCDRGQHEHRVVAPGALEQVAEQGVGVGQRPVVLGPPLAGIGVRAVGGGPCEVRRLDQHDRPPAGIPGVVHRGQDPVAVEAVAVGGGRVVGQQRRAHHSAGHDAVGSHQHGGRPPGVGPLGRVPAVRRALGGVAVGDHGPGEAGVVQVVAEAADVGAEGRVLVELDGRSHAEVGDARAHGAEAPLDELIRRDAPVGLTRVERQGGVQRGRHRPGAGAEREVGVGQRGRAAADPGRHVGDGRGAQEAAEVGQVGVLDVAPRDPGQRHDQHPVRPGVELVRGVAAAGRQRGAGQRQRQQGPGPHSLAHWRTLRAARNDRSALRADKRTVLMVRSLRSLTPPPRARRAVGRGAVARGPTGGW